MAVPVVITKGGRYRAAKQAIDSLKGPILDKLKGVTMVTIKPNFISWRDDMLSITMTDSVKAVVSAFRELGIEKFEICESSPKRYGVETAKFFDDAEYYEWAGREAIELIDLNKTDSVAVFKPLNKYNNSPIRVYKKILESEFVVSLAKLKTHDCLIATLGLKNMIMGSIDWKDKPRIYGFPDTGLKGWDNKAKRKKGIKETLEQMHYNMYLGAHAVYPDLTIIDGVMGMQGNGPVHGDPIMVGATIASTEAIAADEVACKVMGVDFSEIVWEQLLKEKLKIEPEVIGVSAESVKKKFKLHEDYNIMKVDRSKVEELIKENPVKLKTPSKI